MPTVRSAARSFLRIPDPRLQVALIIGALQVLGQTALGFELSVAQILICLGLCAAIEVGVTLWRRRALIWPASALLTGNSVAIIMRAAGTRHGDWWSLNGIDVFVVACVVAMLSKYLLRHRGRHVFNPSNLGLVATFTLFGTQRANPQDLWWGALSPGLWLTLAILVGGGLLITGRLRMLAMAVAFWTAFAASNAVVAAGGHCITARWHYDAVCGGDYWSVMATSPEVLVFLFFMITDPRTTPPSRPGRIAFGAAVGFLAALLAAPMQTEFAAKVAVLDALVVVCALAPLSPLLQRAVRRVPRGALYPVAAAAAAAGALLAAAIPARSTVAIATTEAAAAHLPPITVTAAARAVAGLSDATTRTLVSQALEHLGSTGVTHATVRLLRDPARPQAAPRIAVELQGISPRGIPFARDYVPPSG